MPLTVMVAVRWLVVVLAMAVTVIVPLLLPEAGVTAHHDSLLVTFHPVFDVIVTVFCSPEAAKSNVDNDTDRV